MDEKGLGAKVYDGCSRELVEVPLERVVFDAPANQQVKGQQREDFAKVADGCMVITHFFAVCTDHFEAQNAFAQALTVKALQQRAVEPQQTDCYEKRGAHCVTYE